MVNRTAVILLALHSGIAFASEDLFALSLQELQNIRVSTASKFPRSQAQSAGIISVYSADELALFGGRGLPDVLSKITGITLLNDSPAGRYRMSMRGDLPGINNNHVLILLNGIPLNRESYAGGLWVQSILNSFPLEAIKQIEVVRGPGAVLYGTNAFAGVINIITRKAREMDTEIRLSAGDNETLGGALTVAAESDQGELMAALRYYDSDGEVLNANSTSNQVSKAISTRSPGGILTARHGNFHTNIWWGLAEDDTIRGSDQRLFDGHVRNEKYFINLGYESIPFPDWTMKLDLSHVGGQTDLYDRIIPFGEVEYESNDSRFEFQMLGSLSDDLSVVLGVTIDYLSVRVPPPQQFLEFWDNTLYGAYFQAEYELNNTRFIAGAQFNKSESLKDNTVPRLGIIHHFTETLGMKLIYAEAFRAPYALELASDIQTPVLVVEGNPDLSYETVTTWDAQLFYNTAHSESALTFFRSQQDDLIVRMPASAGPPAVIGHVNQDQLKIEGIELESKYQPGGNWYVTASATWQRNEDGKGREDLTLNPEFIVKAGIGYQAHRWSAGLFDVYQSGYQDNILVSPDRLILNPQSEDSHLLSLNATYTFASLSDLEVGLYVDNVLNEQVYISSSPGFSTSNINTMPSLESGRSLLFSFTLPLD